MQVLLSAALLRHLYCVLGTDTGHAGLVGSGTVTIDTMSISTTNADLISIGTCSFIGTVSVPPHPTDLGGVGQKHSIVIGGHVAIVVGQSSVLGPRVAQETPQSAL